MTNSPSLLLLDENSDLRYLVARALRKRISCKIIETGSVEEAVNLADHEDVDLIVSGYGKAIRFGESLARTLVERGNTTPLLFYSVYEATRFDMGGKNWSVVQIFNPEFDDLIKVVCSAFGLEDKGGSMNPRKIP